MAKSRRSRTLPACYAIVHPGLEEVAAEEITARLGGEIKRTERGVVVFRVDSITPELLDLRTTEDVFLLAWGTDQLTHRATDLDLIQKWTAREPDWDNLLHLHHRVRPKPKGKPTFRLVTQMVGKHGYLRKDAGKAMGKGLEGKIPSSWKYGEEDAAIEFWLSIHGATAVCGLRLSDRTMRHRTYKIEHRPASLRPSIAASMLRLADARASHALVDPMCGAGTILAEFLESTFEHGEMPPALGGDIERPAVRAAVSNLRKVARIWEPEMDRPKGRSVALLKWDAGQLPLPSESVDRIVCNPPFGKQLSSPGMLARLYRRMAIEYDRILRPGGRAVLLVSEVGKLRSVASDVGWHSIRQVGLRVLGQPATITVWQKPFDSDSM